MAHTNSFNAKPTITRLVLPDNWTSVFPTGVVDLGKLQGRLNFLCSDISQVELSDLQQVREIVETLVFNNVCYEPDTCSYGVGHPFSSRMNAIKVYRIRTCDVKKPAIASATTNTAKIEIRLSLACSYKPWILALDIGYVVK